MNEPTDERDELEGLVDPGVYEADVGDRTPSQAVLDAVGALRDEAPPNLPPLYDAIDPEELDRFCTSAGDDARPTVSFRYCGFEVTVHGDEAIAITER